MIKPLCSLTNIKLLATIFVMASLQFYWTGTINHLSIRLCVADIFLILITPAILIRYAQTYRSIPFAQLSPFMLPLAAFSLWLTVSFAMSYTHLGMLDVWALKKWIGWFICMGYLLLGYWIGTQSEDLQKAGWVTLVAINTLTIIFSFLSFGTEDLKYWAWSPNQRMVAFFDNTNAFGLFCVAVLMILSSWPQSRAKFSRVCKITVEAVTSLGLLYSHSRTSLVAFMVVILTQKWWRDRFTLPKGFCIALMVYLIGYSLPNDSPMAFKPAIVTIHDQFSRGQIDHGSKGRLRVISIGFDQWQKDPLCGTGLAMVQQAQNTKEPIEIHSSYLWLLFETGFIGFILMSLVLAVLFKHFFFCPADFRRNQALIIFKGTMLAFIVAALAMEVLYQRYLWVFFGLALANYTKQIASKNIPSLRLDNASDTTAQNVPNPDRYPSAA